MYLNILFALGGGRGHHGHDCMVVGSTTTYAINVLSAQVLSLNPAHG